MLEGLGLGGDREGTEVLLLNFETWELAIRM